MFSSFKIKDEAQIALLKKLGINYVLYIPEKSKAEPKPATADVEPTAVEVDLDAAEQAMWEEKQARIDELKDYRRSLQRSEKAFEQSVKEVRALLTTITARPLNAVQDAEVLIDSIVETLLSKQELLLHLMGDGKESDAFYFHALNVSMLSMMLGRAKGYGAAEIKLLGMAGLFHDIGKLKIPSQILNKRDALTEPELNFLKLHPKYALDFFQHVDGFDERTKTIIFQHHEYIDGSGYPKGLTAGAIDELAKLLALVNEYDALCHPSDPKKQRTPYAVLSYIFKSRRDKFDKQDIELMVRQLGIYPPGTIVQLSNNQLGMVISINQSKLLQPNILLYDPAIPKTEAPIISLDEADLKIEKAIDPRKMPEAAIEYLNPRTRINYYFDSND